MPIRELCLHIIRKCNWLCDHCYYGSAPTDTVIAKRAIPDPVDRGTMDSVMSVYMAFELIRQSKEAGVRRITIQGGEPFMHPNLREIVVEAKRYGMIVAIPTNGNLIRETDYAWIQDYVDMVFVSIHGLADYHDTFVHSQRAFEKSMRSVQKLNELGVKTGVLSSVSLGNHKTILELTKELDRVGVPMHAIFFQTEAGRGTNFDSLKIDQWEAFIETAKALQPSLSKTRIRLEITRVPMGTVENEPIQLEESGRYEQEFLGPKPGELVHKSNRHSCVTCLGVEKHICFCNTEGEFYNCSLLMDQPHFKYTSLAEGGTLRDYFLGISWEWAYEKAPLAGECKSCEFLDICHGGCMAARGKDNKHLNGLTLCDNKTNLPICVLYPDYDVYKGHLKGEALQYEKSTADEYQ